MQAAPTTVRPERSRTSATAAEILAVLGGLLIGVSALVPWMAPPAGAEGDDAHLFHGPGFAVLLIGVLIAISALGRLSVTFQGGRPASDRADGAGRARSAGSTSTVSARPPTVLRAAVLLGAAVAEVAGTVWFAHIYRVDGDVARVLVSGWYIALAGGTVTMASGVVCLVASTGRRTRW